MGKNYRILKEIFLHKIGFILFFAFVCAIALAAEKYFTSDFMVQSGDFRVTAIVKIDDPESQNHPYEELDYSRLFATNSNIKRILVENEKTGKYDFTQIYGNWEGLNETQKYTWLRGHFRTSSARNGILEFDIAMKENEPKDVVYLMDKADALMDDFIKQSEKTLQSVRPGAKIEVASKVIITPDRVNLPKNKLIGKYAIIGFILGAGLAMLILLVRRIGRRK